MVILEIGDESFRPRREIIAMSKASGVTRILSDCLPLFYCACFNINCKFSGSMLATLASFNGLSKVMGTEGMS